MKNFLDYKNFIDRCIENMMIIANACKNITAIVGGPSINPDPKGKNLFNSAFVLSEGKIQQVVSKTLLPTYDVFDE